MPGGLGQAQAVQPVGRVEDPPEISIRSSASATARSSSPGLAQAAHQRGRRPGPPRRPRAPRGPSARRRTSAPATGSGPGVAGGPKRAEQMVEPKIALDGRAGRGDEIGALAQVLAVAHQLERPQRRGGGELRLRRAAG